MSTPFYHEIRVGWGDCDPAKIAYTGRLPWFALDAIQAWLEAHLGGAWYHLELDRNIGMPFVKLGMEFHSPVTPRHRLICEVFPVRLGEKSVTFRVIGRQDGVLCFDGDFTSAFVQPDVFKSFRPPEDVRAAILEHLRPDP